MTVLKWNGATSVKDQANTGTCWSFSTTALLESEDIRRDLGSFSLSPMYMVRKLYLEKAENYLLRQGHAQFDQGGLGHDVIRAIAAYGAMPLAAYTGLAGARTYDHTAMYATLKGYLDSLLKSPPLPAGWTSRFNAILDHYMGKAPSSFTYQGSVYTPRQFASEIMHFDPADYVGLTSFTHHPFGTAFVLEIPDNYANGYYYNLPLKDLIALVIQAVKKGYTVLWDTDISNRGWQPERGYALVPADPGKGSPADPGLPEHTCSQDYRQQLFLSLTTEDDHLMEITGLASSRKGKTFFIVKNSWGTDSSPFQGYVYASVSYFALNTISVILPAAAIDPALAARIRASHPPFYE